MDITSWLKNIWVNVWKNRNELFSHGTVRSEVSQKCIDELN